MSDADIKYLLAKRPAPPRNFSQFARKHGFHPSMVSHWAHCRAKSRRLERAMARELGLGVRELRRRLAA